MDKNENVDNLKKFLVEEFYTLSPDQLKNLDVSFKEIAKQDKTGAITDMVLSEDLEFIDNIYKQYEKTAVAPLVKIFYLLKKITTGLVWSGFNMVGDAKKGQEKMLVVLRPVRLNMGSINQVEQLYSALSEDFPKSRHVMMTKYEINNNVTVNPKLLSEGFVTVAYINDKYDLYFYNMPDKNEFDMLLSIILGLPGYLNTIRNSHYYTGNVSGFNAATRDVIANVVTDDLLLQSSPLDVLRWFNNRMAKKDPTLGIKFCEVTGLPLTHFGDYHDGVKTKFY